MGVLNWFPSLIFVRFIIRVTSHELYYVSNHWHLDCFVNNLFRQKQRKHQCSSSPAFERGIHRSPVDHAPFWFDKLLLIIHIRARMTNYIYCFLWDIIIHPCPDFNSGLNKISFRLGKGWIITSCILSGCDYLPMPWIKCWLIKSMP